MEGRELVRNYSPRQREIERQQEQERLEEEIREFILARERREQKARWIEEERSKETRETTFSEYDEVLEKFDSIQVSLESAESYSQENSQHQIISEIIKDIENNPQNWKLDEFVTEVDNFGVMKREILLIHCSAILNSSDFNNNLICRWENLNDEQKFKVKKVLNISVDYLTSEETNKCQDNDCLERIPANSQYCSDHVPKTLFEWSSSNTISSQEKKILTNFLTLDIKGKKKIFSFSELKKTLEKISHVAVLDSRSFVIPHLVDSRVMVMGERDPNDPPSEWLTWLIKRKSYIPLIGKINKIDTFTTWFNKNAATGHNNCATVINQERNLYNVWVVAYEDPWKKMEGILNIVWTNNYPDYEQAELASFLLKENLNRDCPMLWISPNLGIIENENYLFVNVVKIDINPSIRENILENPDDYVRPLDIVKRKGGSSSGSNSGKGTSSIFHAAVYLGDGWVCHIFVDNPPKEDIISAWSRGGSFGLTTLGFSQKAKAQVRIDSWKDFVKKDYCKELIRYHPVIPFKKDKRIIEHIAKAVMSDYGRGNYNVFTDNCEHFADMIVYGIKLSEQWEKIKEKARNISNSFVGGMQISLEMSKHLPFYLAKTNLQENINDSNIIIGNLDIEVLEESEKKCEQFVIELQGCLKKVNNFSNYFLIPGGFLSENDLKAKRNETIAKGLWKVLIEDNPYPEKLKELTEILKNEEWESFPTIDEIKEIVKEWKEAKFSELFKKHEEIKQWKINGGKWKDSESKKELTRKEILKKWKEEKLETRIELYQPSKEFRGSRS